MYFNANERPVSFLSTMRTLPKAPRPTTRKRRKWLRLTAVKMHQHPRLGLGMGWWGRRRGGRRASLGLRRAVLTFAVGLDGLALDVAHRNGFGVATSGVSMLPLQQQ
jgi:hypothetical protein